MEQNKVAETEVNSRNLATSLNRKKIITITSITAGIILSLIIGVCIGKFLLAKTEQSSENCLTQVEEEAVENTKQSSDDGWILIEEEVMEEIAPQYSEIKNILSSVSSIETEGEYWTGSWSNIRVSYDVSPLFVDDLQVYTDAAMGLMLTYTYFSDNDDYGALELDNMKTSVEKVLQQNGFDSVGAVSVPWSAGAEPYGFRKENIQCTIWSDSNKPSLSEPTEFNLYVSCQNADWTQFTESELNTAKQLIQAYYEKEGEYPGNLRDFEQLTIKDSKYGSYQYTTAGVNKGAGLFYRTSSESPWQYFTTTIMPLKCSDYNTDDLKKAYLGDTCYLDDDITESTVSL